MNFFRDNQDTILNPEQQNSLAQIYKPIYSKPTLKSDGNYDILFTFQDELYIAKHVRLTPMKELLPLDFMDAFILRYDDTVESFKKNGHILNEEHIENDFSYELTNPEELERISFGIMTSFPFMDEFTNKIIIDSSCVKRNEPCPCGSGKKYKVCCSV